MEDKIAQLLFLIMKQMDRQITKPDQGGQRAAEGREQAHRRRRQREGEA